MTIVLYQMPVSVPCRTVLMTAEHLGIKLELKHINLLEGEQMKQEFLAINPQHCVPTIDDDGFYLWESRAIVTYLVNKYAPDSPLYPKDPEARAVVDKMLNYDLGSLFRDFIVYVMNPQHCLPTIDDDGFYLWESRAIVTYLANRYAPDNPLYPKDPRARAVVDMMLNYDHGNLFRAYMDCILPAVVEKRPADPEKTENLKKSIEIFEKILEKTPYAAGHHLTLADYSIFANLMSLEVIIDYKFDDFPKVSAWLQRMKKETPKHMEINEIPLREMKKRLEESKK